MESKRKFWTLRAASVLLVLVLLTTHLCSGLFARYISFASGEDSARVAKFDFNVTSIQFAHTSLNESLADGDVTDLYLDSTQSHNFKMFPSNGNTFYKFKFANSSEVDVRVTITYETTGNIPLHMAFRDTATAPGTRVVKTKVTQTFDMEANTGTKTLYLWLDWPNEGTTGVEAERWNYKLNSEIDNATLTIDCRQID